MSKLSDFTNHLAEIKPGEHATLSYEGAVWLIAEIDRIQNVAKQALLDQRAAEAENKEFKRIEELQRRFDEMHSTRELDEEK